MFRRALLPLLLASLATTAQAQSQAKTQPQPRSQSSLQDMTEREITLLQFDGGGSPLTVAERQQAAEIVREAMADPAAHWVEVDERAQKVIAVLNTRDPKTTARLWDASRYGDAFPTAAGPLRRYAAMEKRIIDAHDPVLFLDAPHQRMITAHMLPAVRQVSIVVAGLYSLPAPKADFDTVLRGQLHQMPTVDEAVADGLAHIVRYQPFLLPYFAGLPAERRAAFVKSSKAAFNHLDEPGMEEWELAETGAMQSRFAARQAGSSSSVQSLAYGAKMQNMWSANGARSLSGACNPTLSTSARTQNNCIAPIPVPGLP